MSDNRGELQSDDRLAIYRALGAAQGPLTKREEYVVEALQAFAAHPIIVRIEALLVQIGDRLHNPLPIDDERFERIERAFGLVKLLQQNLIPAEYALASPKLTNALTALERYVAVCLEMPSTVHPEIRTRLADEEWRVADFAWESLDQGRWRSAENPEAYVRSVTNRLISARENQENQEFHKAAEEKITLSSDADLSDAQQRLLQEVHAQETPEEPSRDVEDLPIELRVCADMASQGAKWSDIAAYLGTDTSHLLQRVRRLAQRYHVVGPYQSPDHLSREFISEVISAARRNNLLKGQASGGINI